MVALGPKTENEELYELYELRDRVVKRIEELEEEQSAWRSRRAGLRKLLATTEALDVIAPKHAPARGHACCSDGHPVGMKRARLDREEFPCLRCVLIEARDDYESDAEYRFSFFDGVAWVDSEALKE